MHMNIILSLKLGQAVEHINISGQPNSNFKTRDNKSKVGRQ